VRAVVLTEQPPELELAEIGEPEPAAGETIVSVTACGICGSDLHVASVIGQPGTVLGHEIAGVIESCGADAAAAGWKVGQPVAVRPLSGCGSCRWCDAGRPDHCDRFRLLGMDRPGGFAERVAVPTGELFALPTSLQGPEQALVEPLAVARRALRRDGLVPGESMAVIGAGPIGLATVAWARALGAGRIIVSDPSSSRRDLAMALGADVAVDPTEVDLGQAVQQHLGELPASVIECSGRAEQIGEAMTYAAVDGRVTVVGVCITEASITPWFGLFKELDIRFSLYYGREDFTDTLGALDDGSLQPGTILTETVGLADLPARFARLSAEPDGGKVVVTPNS
jgi:(R,R)-butanediol dehydrogenase/meso-butanediol dehydrogenase/diacetyl reductase